MPELDPAIQAYYERGSAAGRLTGGLPSSPLELERTRELILRAVPQPPLRVPDIGGGAGMHASWLAALGYDVHLIDTVSLHIEQALNALVVASEYLGPDGSVVLVDRRARPGGMWIDTYDYVPLHQPHPMFTAGDIPWQLDKDRSHLATNSEVLNHLQHC